MHVGKRVRLRKGTKIKKQGGKEEEKRPGERDAHCAIWNQVTHFRNRGRTGQVGIKLKNIQGA